MLHKPTIMMLIGPPGSGKSTWIKQFMENDSNDWTVISTDVFIEKYAAEQGITYSEAFYKLPFKTKTKFNIALREAVNKKKHIIWDQTNLSIKIRRKKMLQTPKYVHKAVAFELDYDELFRRLEKRQNETGKSVSDKIVNQMIETYERPTKSEGFVSVELIIS